MGLKGLLLGHEVKVYYDRHLTKTEKAEDAEIGRDGGIRLQRGWLARAENGQWRGDEVHAAREERCSHD